jgi:hypothetical protein
MRLPSNASAYCIVTGATAVTAAVHSPLRPCKLALGRSVATDGGAASSGSGGGNWAAFKSLLLHPVHAHLHIECYAAEDVRVDPRRWLQSR